MNEELIGQVVMIHPDLTSDPAQRMGELAVITASPEPDTIKVKFPDEQAALYGLDAVLVFKSPGEIYDHLEVSSDMPKKDFRDLRNVALLLERGNSNHHRTAMEIIQQNPDLKGSALRTLEEQFAMDYIPNRGRKT